MDSHSILRPYNEYVATLFLKLPKFLSLSLSAKAKAKNRLNKSRTIHLVQMNYKVFLFAFIRFPPRKARPASVGQKTLFCCYRRAMPTLSAIKPPLLYCLSLELPQEASAFLSKRIIKPFVSSCWFSEGVKIVIK